MLDTQILRLPVEAIAPNPYQPRTDFAPEPLAELADSIRRHGILQPLTVRRTKTGWELVAGERRLRAAKLAGLDTVPCLQIRAEDQESALLALIENIQRKDLHYFEEAAAIAAYLRQSGVTQEEAAALLGRSPSALANKLRLLRLSPAVQQALIENNIPERLARALLQLPDEDLQQRAIRHMAAGELNVRQGEEYLRQLLHRQQHPPYRGLLRDYRILFTTVDRAVEEIRRFGVAVTTRRREEDDCISYTIRIPKSAKKEREPKDQLSLYA